jgi:riboflavin synthase
MFTGLIEDIGTVKNIFSSKIEIETKFKGISRGESIAVNGVCLTAVCEDRNIFKAEYSPNSDKITTLSKLKRRSKVNLERALRISGRLGGHIVSGHVDGTARIKRIEVLKEFYRFEFLCERDILRYCVDRGSISVEGISLTISKVSDYGFEIYIIPETFNNTTMRLKREGDKVNIETDILAKYIDNSRMKESRGISYEKLKEFMER